MLFRNKLQGKEDVDILTGTLYESSFLYLALGGCCGGGGSNPVPGPGRVLYPYDFTGQSF